MPKVLFLALALPLSLAFAAGQTPEDASGGDMRKRASKSSPASPDFRCQKRLEPFPLDPTDAAVFIDLAEQMIRTRGKLKPLQSYYRDEHGAKFTPEQLARFIVVSTLYSSPATGPFSGQQSSRESRATLRNFARLSKDDLRRFRSAFVRALPEEDEARALMDHQLERLDDSSEEVERFFPADRRRKSEDLKNRRR